jgi:hypothetical protein
MAFNNAIHLAMRGNIYASLDGLLDILRRIKSTAGVVRAVCYWHCWNCLIPKMSKPAGIARSWHPFCFSAKAAPTQPLFFPLPFIPQGSIRVRNHLYSLFQPYP